MPLTLGFTIAGSLRHALLRCLSQRASRSVPCGSGLTLLLKHRYAPDAGTVVETRLAGVPAWCIVPLWGV